MTDLKHLLPDNWPITLADKTYVQHVKRENPTAILFLIDQSGSMDNSFKDKTYAEVVADMINSSLNELVGRCTKSEGIRDYFDVLVIGYGGKSSTSVEILWEGNLKNKTWVTMSELKDNSLFKEMEVQKNIRGKISTTTEQVPYWFVPKANSLTPMGAAMDRAYTYLHDWITDVKHHNAFPPVVIHITDGKQTDCSESELLKKANKIKSLHTTDGHVLLLNCHINNSDESIVFPTDEEQLPDNNYCHQLFAMSSEMPLLYHHRIQMITNNKASNNLPRGFAFNANVDALFNLIDIGTSGVTVHITQ